MDILVPALSRDALGARAVVSKPGCLDRSLSSRLVVGSRLSQTAQRMRPTTSLIKTPVVRQCRSPGWKTHGPFDRAVRLESVPGKLIVPLLPAL